MECHNAHFQYAKSFYQIFIEPLCDLWLYLGIMLLISNIILTKIALFQCRCHSLSLMKRGLFLSYTLPMSTCPYILKIPWLHLVYFSQVFLVDFLLLHFNNREWKLPLWLSRVLSLLIIWILWQYNQKSATMTLRTFVSTFYLYI